MDGRLAAVYVRNEMGTGAQRREIYLEFYICSTVNRAVGSRLVCDPHTVCLTYSNHTTFLDVTSFGRETVMGDTALYTNIADR